MNNWQNTSFLSYQAGEKHYHPQCSRCARCHGVFGEGQEMFLQGKEIHACRNVTKLDTFYVLISNDQTVIFR